MNLMKQMKRKWGRGAVSEKKRVIFFCERSKTVFLASLMFIYFIKARNSTFGTDGASFVALQTPYLMKLVNVYVVGIFKRFFENIAHAQGELMKRLCSSASCRFIN